MITHGKSIKIFTGNSNPELAKAICQELGVPLGNAEVGSFADGENYASIYETVRGSDVFVVQSTCPFEKDGVAHTVNDALMELLIMIDALKRASAGRITAVIPYFGYARQDRKTKPRDPISAKLVANLITRAGADRVLTMDLHANQIQGFFDIPVDNLLGSPLFVNEFFRKYAAIQDETMVVSPDVGSVARARAFAQKLAMPLAIVGCAGQARHPSGRHGGHRRLPVPRRQGPGGHRQGQERHRLRHPRPALRPRRSAHLRQRPGRGGLPGYHSPQARHEVRQDPLHLRGPPVRRGHQPHLRGDLRLPAVFLNSKKWQSHFFEKDAHKTGLDSFGKVGQSCVRGVISEAHVLENDEIKFIPPSACARRRVSERNRRKAAALSSEMTAELLAGGLLWGGHTAAPILWDRRIKPMFFSRQTGGASWLIVGLGNPGEKYEDTRHNVGFQVVDELAERQNAPVQKLKFKALTNLLTIAGERVLVMKPVTYMNLSTTA